MRPQLSPVLHCRKLRGPCGHARQWDEAVALLVALHRRDSPHLLVVPPRAGRRPSSQATGLRIAVIDRP
eukprot:scaffold23532_cov31-Tisochrysis_lutea.AAC.1